MNARVKSVVAKEGYQLEITFEDGVTGIYDCTPLLDWGVFQELRDFAYFVQVRASGGTVIWPHEQDICPDVLYEESRKVAAR